MRNRLAFVSYSLVTLAGICFISGAALIASERGL
jgi:hypothetical protein